MKYLTNGSQTVDKKGTIREILNTTNTYLEFNQSLLNR